MKKTIKNSLFLIKEIYRADRWRIPYSFFNAVFTATIQVFFHVYIVKHIVNNVFLFQNLLLVFFSGLPRSCQSSW